MFIQNKYTIWYIKIISNATDRIKDPATYYERHHIIPRCMNGSDNKDNLVNLTAREHFICHILLTKMISRESEYYFKLLNAALKMKSSNNNQERYVNSRLYNSIRINFGNCQKIKMMGKGNTNYGMIWINQPELNVVSKIKLERLNEYLGQGWEMGRSLSYRRRHFIYVHGKIRYTRTTFRKILKSRLFNKLKTELTDDEQYWHNKPVVSRNLIKWFKINEITADNLNRAKQIIYDMYYIDNMTPVEIQQHLNIEYKGTFAGFMSAQLDIDLRSNRDALENYYQKFI